MAAARLPPEERGAGAGAGGSAGSPLLPRPPLQLVIAEKPSVARDLARVLGVRPTGQTAFEGPGHVITWCVGHLVELEEPAAYDSRWKAWRLDTLPMLPSAFKLRPAKHAVAQLHAVTRLLREPRFASVVNACDAGREGELIFRYLYQYAGARLPVVRLWISSLTDDAIRRGFGALRPGQRFDALGDAARARSEADWLVGMNATRAVTARGRQGQGSRDAPLYSIGRVQTPTLAMLVAREQAIAAFVPREYWEVRGTFVVTGGGGASAGSGGGAAGSANARFTAGWVAPGDGRLTRLARAPLADTLVSRCEQHGRASDPAGPRVLRLRARTVREPHPLLFDLTSLQRTANRRFGFSAARTLEIAQALYERHKVLSYPRTDSRHLTTDVAKELPQLIAAVGALPEYAPFAARLAGQPLRPGRRVIDDSKVQDHHAIIPTGKTVRPGTLDHDEQRLFDLVVRRFLGAFFPDAEFDVTDVWIRVGAQRGAGGAPSGPPEPVAPDAAGREPSAAAESPGVGKDETPTLENLPPPPDHFFARGRIRRVAGWQEVAGLDGREERPADRSGARPPARGGRRGSESEGDDGEGAEGGGGEGGGVEEVAVLPPLAEGQPLEGHFEPLAKRTVPPRRFTEATLLGAMESAGKSIDDEALRAAMKDSGLGTPATRAAVIETLLKRDYIARQKKQLVPTATGMALIEALPVQSLASAELTGSWEARLARIARGEDSREAFMADIALYVSDTVEAVRSARPPALSAGRGAEGASTALTPVGRCPRCGGAVTEQARAFACSQPGCPFSMRKQVARRDIAAPLAGVLLERRRSQVLKGFHGKGGKRFAAALVLEESGELRFDFQARDQPAERPAPGAGPDVPPAARPTRAAGAPRAARPAKPAVAKPGEPVAVKPVEVKPVAVKPVAVKPVAAVLESLGCPRCRQGTLMAGKRGWGCTRWREGCRFVIWFEAAGRRLTVAQLRDLVLRGKTRKARFAPTGPAGPAAEGRLVLDVASPEGGARFQPA